MCETLIFEHALSRETSYC